MLVLLNTSVGIFRELSPKYGKLAKRLQLMSNIRANRRHGNGSIWSVLPDLHRRRQSNVNQGSTRKSSTIIRAIDDRIRYRHRHKAGMKTSILGRKIENDNPPARIGLQFFTNLKKHRLHCNPRRKNRKISEWDKKVNSLNKDEKLRSKSDTENYRATRPHTWKPIL